MDQDGRATESAGAIGVVQGKGKPIQLANQPPKPEQSGKIPEYIDQQAHFTLVASKMTGKMKQEYMDGMRWMWANGVLDQRRQLVPHSSTKLNLADYNACKKLYAVLVGEEKRLGLVYTHNSKRTYSEMLKSHEGTGGVVTRIDVDDDGSKNG